MRSRAKVLLGVAALSWLLPSCGGGGGGSGGGVDSAKPPPKDEIFDEFVLDADQVTAIMQSAARAQPRPVAVAVSDRRGELLGVATNFGFDRNDYEAQCVTACPLADLPLDSDSDCAIVNRAAQLARTAAFFSANETPLTSRSVRFLSGEHFPPRIRNTGAAALFGIENTNRGCSFDTVPTLGPPRPDLDDGTDAERRSSDAKLAPRALGLATEIDSDLPCESSASAADQCGCSTGIATLPGGVPIFRNSVVVGGVPSSVMVGGVGVAVREVGAEPDPIAAFDAPELILRRDDRDEAFDVGEFAARAFAGDAVADALPLVERRGLVDLCTPTAGVDMPACCADAEPCVFSILPALPRNVEPVIFVDGIEIPEIAFEPDVDGVGDGNALSTPLIVDAQDSLGVAPSGWLVTPRDATVGPLTAGDVEDIILAGVAEARRIRAAIRLPLVQRTAMVLAVSDLAGELLGAFRMPDATVFSIDVAVAKARNVTYFSSETIDAIDTRDCPGPVAADCGDPFFPADGLDSTAITNRTISFASQPFFPPGIDGTGSTPNLDPGPFRRIFVEDSATPCTNAGEDPNGRQNGIVFFPGSAPLYVGDQLVGGLGVSGDGVEQDDIVTFAGTRGGSGFEAPEEIRADQIQVREDIRLPYLKFNRQPEE